MVRVTDWHEDVSWVFTGPLYRPRRDDHIVWRMMTVILGYEHRRVVLGLRDAAEWAFETNLATKCLTFEVHFDSEASVQQGPVRAVSAVTSKVFIALDPDSLRVTGHSSLTNTTFKITSSVGGGCTIKGTRGGSDLKVVDLTFAFTPGTKADDPGTLKDIALTYLPAATTESGSISCPGAPMQPFSSLRWSDHRGGVRHQGAWDLRAVARAPVTVAIAASAVRPARSPRQGGA